LSTVSVSFFPPTSTVIEAESGPTFTSPIFAEVWTSMPRFLNDFATSAEHSASSSGRMEGATSISVTLVPKALKTSANSQPTAPAPTTAIVLGACSSTSTSSDESTTFLSSASPACGSPRTRDPVATTTAFLASCFSALPSAPVTLTVRGATSFAVPLRWATLFFFIRNSTPFEFCVLTARDRFMAVPYSNETSPTVMPKSLAWRILLASAALSRSALAGMHPQRTQVPPRASRSMMAVERPSWAQRMAQT
jgi:hypothetical protein